MTDSILPDEDNFKFHPDFNDPAADVIILSSDPTPTAFRIHTYTLQHLRWVLRPPGSSLDAFKPSLADRGCAVLGDLPGESVRASNAKLLRLTDPDTETAPVVHLWLSITAGKPSPAPSRTMWAALLRAVEFSDKYDCPTAVRLLLHEARRYVPVPVPGTAWAWTSAEPFEVFMLGATHGDPELSASALAQAGSGVWPRPNTTGHGDGDAPPPFLSPEVRLNTRASPFDVSSWTAAELDRVNSYVTIALLRATRHRQLAHKAGHKARLDSVDWKSVGQDYLKWYWGFKSTAAQEEEAMQGVI